MKELHSLVLAGGMTVAISLGISPALASDTAGGTDSDGPTVEQIHNSKDRLWFEQPGGKALTPRGSMPLQPGATKVAPTTNALKTMHQSNANDQVGKKPKVISHTPSVVPAHIQHSTIGTAKVHKHTSASAQTTPKTIKTATTGAEKQIQPAAFVASSDDSNANVLKAWLNKTGSGPHYKKGERMEINVSADRDCNLVIFDFDGKGTLTQLFPNQYQPNGALKSGETVSVGGQASPFEYTANLEDGQQRSDEKLFVYAYPVDRETPLSVAMSPVTSAPFRSSKLSPAEYKKMVTQAPAFFKSTERNVKITPRANVKMVSADATQAPNKIELPVVIER